MRPPCRVCRVPSPSAACVPSVNARSGINGPLPGRLRGKNGLSRFAWSRKRDGHFLPLRAPNGSPPFIPFVLMTAVPTALAKGLYGLASLKPFLQELAQIGMHRQHATGPGTRQEARRRAFRAR